MIELLYYTAVFFIGVLVGIWFSPANCLRARRLLRCSGSKEPTCDFCGKTILEYPCPFCGWMETGF